MNRILAQVEEKIDAGDLDGARDLVRKHIRSHRNSVPLHELLGWIEYRRNETERCLEALEHATLLGPIADRSRTLIAVAYARVGRFELAIDLLDMLVDGGAEHSEVPVLLLAASGYDTAGRPDLAMRCCRRAARIDPQNAEAYHLASRYGEHGGLPTRLVESLARRAVALDPECAGFRIRLATLLQGEGRAAEAADAVRELALDQLRDLCCRQCAEYLAETYESIGDWRRAVVCREQLLRLEVSAQRDHRDD